MRIFDVLDTFSDFKKPIHLSEITISAYSNSYEDLAIQAEIAKNMYKIWFSQKMLKQLFIGILLTDIPQEVVQMIWEPEKINIAVHF